MDISQNSIHKISHNILSHNDVLFSHSNALFDESILKICVMKYEHQNGRIKMRHSQTPFFYLQIVRGLIRDTHIDSRYLLAEFYVLFQ